tara:strand:+ start:138 stop:689 length:552 start_codon:yes stop_codon:yes gene_type:complete
MNVPTDDEQQPDPIRQKLLVFGLPVVILLAVVIMLCVGKVKQYQCGKTIEDALHTQPFRRASLVPYSPQSCKPHTDCTFQSDVYQMVGGKYNIMKHDGKCFEIPPTFWWEYVFPPHEMFLRFSMLALFAVFGSYVSFTLYQRGFFSLHDTYAWTHCDTTTGTCNTGVSQSHAQAHEANSRPYN